MKFGAPCFIHIPQQTRLKARLDEPKAVPGRIVGQADNISGWIVQVSSTGEIHPSRDILIENAALPRVQQTIMAQEVPSDSARVISPIVPAIQLRGIADHSAEDPASRVYDPQDRTVTFGEPGVPITGLQERSSAVNGESPYDRASCHGQDDNIEVRPALPALAAPAPDIPTRNRPGRQATSTRRVRPSANWELIPERRINSVALPPALFTNLDGRRVMTRRAPGRLPRFVPDTSGEMEIDDELEVVEQVNVDRALSIGWVLSALVDDDEPRSVAEALQGPNALRWQAAIDKELDNLGSKGTWTEVEKPADRKTIGSRSILKVKRDALGNVVKFRRRCTMKSAQAQRSRSLTFQVGP